MILNQGISRREFIKALIASTTAIFFPLCFARVNSENSYPPKHIIQDETENTEFVIIDGWVLLKKDLIEH